jgi:wax ester synthase-like acyl-CoA acyltransferase family protein
MARTIRKLTASDASYLYVETPEVPMHIGSMAIFQLPDNFRGDFFEDFKAMIGRRLHLAPMLTWKLAHTPLDIDHPSWTEDRYRPSHIPWCTPGTLRPGDTSTHRRLATCEATQSRSAAVGGLRIRLPTGQPGRNLLQNAPRMHRWRCGCENGATNLRRLALAEGSRRATAPQDVTKGR